MRGREQRYKNQRRLIRIVKKIWQPLRFGPDHPKNMLFIVGSQRSGTTLMLTKILELDLNTKVYGEFSRLSSEDVRNIRLNPLCSVKRVVGRDRAGLIVLKPLVESQHTGLILSYFQRAKALWMYRHYGDVASSSLKKFGAKRCLDRLRGVIGNKAGDWRAERVPEAIRELVSERFSENMNPHDAAALFWFVRNSLFFDQNLHRNPHARLCRYEDLVTDPIGTMRDVYMFAGQDFPGKGIVREVSDASVGKGNAVRLSSDTENLCEPLLERLVHADRERRAGKDAHKADTTLFRPDVLA